MINVLSLFDGMRCGAMALQRAGIPINQYYSSEVDKWAIKAGRVVYPQAIELGNVLGVSAFLLPKIDLLIGGSPCQGFSFAGKQLNFEDPRSKLFFEYVRLLKEIRQINPEVKFMLENVRMKKEFIKVISEALGVEPIAINSNLVSAQNRYRLYWTNIEGINQPEDKGIFLKDIVHENTWVCRDKSHCIDANYFKGANLEQYLNKHRRQQVFDVESKVLLVDKEQKHLKIPEATKKGFTEVRVGEGVDTTFINSKTRRGRLMKDKSNCLTAANYEYGILEDLKEYIVPFDKILQILDKEVERGKVGYFRKDSQANRVYYIHGKAVTLCGDAGAASKMGQYLFGRCTKAMTNIEHHRSTNGLKCIGGLNKNRKWLDDGKTKQRNFSQGERVYSTEGKAPTCSAQSGGTAGAGSSLIFGCITPDRVNKRQNGQRFNDGKKFYTLTAQDKHGILVEGYIRKLTPIECGRLQTVPDQTIMNILDSGVSKTQVYKMLGNGWTVDVIAHIFKNFNRKG